ncbi:Gfo/Idh/MocA family protein [Tessaracoccus oleiagri]|uniref:Predicted dehydrogenase n=1 Tax=Tessaracoccus oleiagri TaxID=686624 RepID=A0A1G9LRE0_9ACTN|nr:Gfo/Idh/MocA family oxidoreductase [Tessaracoccus oleiagri]SDL64529.1 Predicted dehydrogenase [Tessaracoccus oleiagri]
MEPVRIAILGAAGIAPTAIIRPAAKSPDAEIVAVAARNRDTAEAFASQHGIPTVLPDYESALADDSVDAVYIPLPNSLHAPWTIRALRAGKHVLVEKPFANNHAQALEVAEVAAGIDRVCMEAFHYRYHPLWAETKRLLAEIGDVQRAEATFDIHLPDRSNIRYDYELGGGALMDLGCYPLHLLRSLLGTEPEVVDAGYRPAPDARVDEALWAELLFGDVPARLACSLLEDQEVVAATFTGTEGTLHVEGFVKPHEGNSITLTTAAGERSKQFPLDFTSYDAQLQVFVEAVRGGGDVVTGPEDSVATMRAIDAIYENAGLPLRGA